MATTEQLKHCKVCLNRTFDMRRGMLCGLTDDQPTFTDSCPDFKEDAEAKKEEEAKQQDLGEVSADGETKKGFFGSVWSALLLAVLGVVRGLMKGFDNPFAYIFIGIGVAWFIIAIVQAQAGSR